MNTMRPYLMANKAGWLKSRGVIRYDPRRKNKRNTDYWCVVETDPEINRLYRYMVDRNLLNITGVPGHGLNHPSGGPHISVVRGLNDVRGVSRAVLEDLWGKYNGLVVEFLYNTNARSTASKKNHAPGDYWFLDVDCPKITSIRQEMGLISTWNYHITIGRTNF